MDDLSVDPFDKRSALDQLVNILTLSFLLLPNPILPSSLPPILPPSSLSFCSHRPRATLGPMSSQAIAAYSWGLNLFGQTGVSQSPSAIESGRPFDCVELPTPIAVSVLPPLKSPNKSLSPQNSQNGQKHNKKKMPASKSNGKDSDDDEDDNDMSKTNDPWKLRTMSGKGGGFIMNDTYMVYGSMDDLDDDSSSSSSSKLHIGGVAAGAFNTLLYLTDGRLFGCGWNGRGQLGLPLQTVLAPPPSLRSVKFGASGASAPPPPSSSGSIVVDRYPALTPIPFPTALLATAPIKVTTVACGPYHSLCATTHGHVYSWGDGTSGQLGYSYLDVASAPVARGGGGGGAPQSSSSSSSSSASTFRQCTPLRVDGALNSACQVAAGFDFSVVVSSSGALQAFGGNEYGQLGIGLSAGATIGADQRKVFRPTDVPLPEPCKEVSAGDYHVLYLARSGAVYSCGLGDLGRLGLGDGGAVEDRNSHSLNSFAGGKQKKQPLNGNVHRPTAVDFFDAAGVHVTAVRCGGACSGAISASGELYTWGSNESGQLGVVLGDAGRGFEPSPVLNRSLRLSRSKVTDASFGEEHGAAVCSDGTVYTFGKASCGRLGIKDAALVSDATLVGPTPGETDYCALPYARAVAADDGDGGEGEEATPSMARAVVAVESAALDPPPPEGFDYRHPAPGGSFTAAIGESAAPADVARTPICIGMVVEEGDDEDMQLSSLVARGAKVAMGKLQQHHKKSTKAVVCGGAHTVAFSRAAVRDGSGVTPPLLARCSNEVRGCPGLLTLERMDRHLAKCSYGMEACPFTTRGCEHFAPKGGGLLDRHAAGCRFRPVDCDLCGKKKVSAKDFDTHLREECSASSVGCSKCGDESIRRKDLERHLACECAERVATCPNACGYLVQIGKGETVEAHEQSCPCRLVVCASCSGKFRFECMPDHEAACSPPPAAQTAEEEDEAPQETSSPIIQDGGALPLTQQERRASAAAAAAVEQETTAPGRKGSTVKRVGGGYAARK